MHFAMSIRSGLLALFLMIAASCATYKPQSSLSEIKRPTNEEKAIEHSFYLMGDAGKSPMGGLTVALQAFKAELGRAAPNSTAIFLGDNIYEKGMPEKGHMGRAFAEHQMNAQAATLTDFPGQAIFIPGNHDWYGGGVEALKRQENYLEDLLVKNTFLPENGCAIESRHISENIELIIIDSQWFIVDWDRHPTLNDDCDIKTREVFFDEYESLIKKARGKTTVVAIHHPMYANGPHGGQFTFRSHMTPLPVLGSVKNLIRKTSGVINADLINRRYNELRKRLVTISQDNEKVIFVSGHDHNLQYLEEDNLHQIVSGSGAKKSATRCVGGGQFSYGTHGYAVLDIFRDGSSSVRFFSAEDSAIVFQKQVLPADVDDAGIYDHKKYGTQVSASVYAKKETEKSAFHKFLWGERYRDIYSTMVSAPTVNLDTMFGGLSVVRKGGGNQSMSLRLEDKTGVQYVMRALRKNPVQYLQAIMFKDQYIEGQFDDTSTEAFILDVFAGAHPYAPFTIGPLADAIGVYHTSPVLYFVPKQRALGHFNDEFGDQLYMIEEHTSDGHAGFQAPGYQHDIVGTSEMMKKIHADEDIMIDEALYIRSRLFDMLIGDWDRHQDQWRWIEVERGGKRVYLPLPRDRDQAFSNIADGFLLKTAVALVPEARVLRNYDEELEDVKGMNAPAYALDMELIQTAKKEVWDAQVQLIQNNINDDVIEAAFLNFPEEVRGKSVDMIKSKLQGRLHSLQQISDRYYAFINRFSVVKGSNKDDWFEIERLPKGTTKITAFRIQGGKKGEKFFEHTYQSDKTKEIWIYALDDNDVFHVFGNHARHRTKVRLIGGQNNDTYDIEQGKGISFYDYKSKESTVLTSKGRKKFTDDYETNVYDYKKLKYNTNRVIPTIGRNPDDGLKIGISDKFTINGFERNPFTQQHHIATSYYFATRGFDLSYSGEIAAVAHGVNFGLDSHFNSPNYAINFFGYGNTTPNFEADKDDEIDVDMDFNRVRVRTFRAMPSVILRGELGSQFKVGLVYEANEIERTPGRFLDGILDLIDPSEEEPDIDSIFVERDFYGLDAAYHFDNKDNKAFPTIGMEFFLHGGFRNNWETDKDFYFLISELGIAHKLIASGQVVLASRIRTHFNLGDDYEFYQAATIGASTGLRGYRNQRFTGQHAFVQSSEVRWNFLNVKTALIPVSLGVFAAFDYGRVWVDDDRVILPDSNENRWHSTPGIGLFVDMAEMLTANFSAFDSDEGLRLAFRLGFQF
jgi:hypothetical protein